jgi:hypothetical protein
MELPGGGKREMEWKEMEGKRKRDSKREAKVEVTKS